MAHHSTTPRPYTPDAVARLRSALDAALSDAVGDGFDGEDPSVYFDLVHAVALGARGEEHPTTIAEFLRCEGLDPR